MPERPCNDGFLSLNAECALGVDAKWDRLPCPNVKDMLPSVCLRNAANSGLASRGRCCGVPAPKDCIEEVGGLQLFRSPALVESLGSVEDSGMMPK